MICWIESSDGGGHNKYSSLIANDCWLLIMWISIEYLYVNILSVICTYKLSYVCISMYLYINYQWCIRLFAT